jgi:PAS domain S-box-containing protein
MGFAELRVGGATRRETRSFPGGEIERRTHPDPDVDVTHALKEMAVPAVVIDRHGRFRWLNRGAMEVFGDRVGQPFTRVVAPEDRQLARTHVAKKLIGEAASSDYNLTLIGRDARRVPVRVSSVPLREAGEISGVFGLAYPAEVPPLRVESMGGEARTPELTARQHETLGLLAEGLGTAAIATRLGVAEETARNHIRSLLGRLGAHSRLEAVVRAYRLGLVQPPGDD